MFRRLFRNRTSKPETAQLDPSLIADLHGDNVPPAAAEALWPIARRDPEALRELNRLDRVNDALADLSSDYARDPAHTSPPAIPDDVDARLTAALGIAPPAQPVDAHVVPLNAGQRAGDPQMSWRERLIDRARLVPGPVLAAGSVAVAALVVVGFIAVGNELRSDESVAPVRSDIGLTPTATTTETPPTTTRPKLTIPTTLPPLSDLTPEAFASALGKSVEVGPLADRGRLNGCLRAIGIGPERPVLGGRTYTYDGRSAVLVLVPGPVPPQITALVVGPDCSADNPDLITQQTVG